MRRNGSALLIVLGMMAFMVVSAVAFSAYMRAARLPSSYLRRTSASRHLVKAALARAIDTVDRAIANNPHPGVGSQFLVGQNKNRWPGRVLLATNRIDRVDDTVPVLTLEGLAYIPPPLVNEARYYSRLTSTAAWQQFGFDSGRYAFCAIDVSDYFDVNRMSANVPRSSASNRRISLAYLFEDGEEHTSAGSGAQAWDTFMEKFRKIDDQTLSFKYDTLVPLVSVADLNLALGDSGQGGLYSPFCKYIKNSGGDGFYNNDFEMPRRMTFVTDSLYPATTQATDDDDSDYDEIYDLNDSECQPFTAALLGGAGGPRSLNNTSIVDIMSSGQKSKVRLMDSMPAMSLVALYDYLDKNSVPVSLACPTVERAPMICGIKPNLAGQFALKLNADIAGKVTDVNGNELHEDVKTTQTRDAYATYEYNFDPTFFTSLASLNIETLLVYPFAHEDAVSQANFNVDARATFFFSTDSDPVKMRTGKADDSIHANNKDNFSKDKGLIPANGTIVVPFPAMPKNFKLTNVSQEDDAIFDMALRSTVLPGSEANKESVARIRFRWQQTWDAENGRYLNWAMPSTADIDFAHCGVPPLARDGKPDLDFVNDASFLNIVKGGAKANVTLNMSIMVRVTDDNNRTVDLVPAHMRDDNTFNGINNNNFLHATRIAGSAYPVMRFPTSASFAFTKEGLANAVTAQPAEPLTKAVRIDDPRYNYAPESWYDAGGDISKQTWLAQNGSKDRDGDIFMATSDQGYLQSIYELAFLPRLSNLESAGDGIMGSLANPDDGRAVFGTQGQAMNGDLMWNTYRLIPRKNGMSDDFEGLGFTSAGTGTKINPYSDSTNVLMAAFANTPVDWRMASTNNSEVALEEMDADEFNKNYAWNEYSGKSKFKWKDLESVARRLIDNIAQQEQRNALNGSFKNWKQAWRDLGWMYDSSNPDTFCGVPLSGGTELWGVDREYLYGFWRDCFAVKQQLFLIFVRAEPLMMGGGRVNQTPPQLGARAVALVWRDPTKTTEANTEGGNVGYPHRTRILFYRQLD